MVMGKLKFYFVKINVLTQGPETEFGAKKKIGFGNDVSKSETVASFLHQQAICNIICGIVLVFPF